MTVSSGLLSQEPFEDPEAGRCVLLRRTIQPAYRAPALSKNRCATRRQPNLFRLHRRLFSQEFANFGVCTCGTDRAGIPSRRGERNTSTSSAVSRGAIVLRAPPSPA